MNSKGIKPIKDKTICMKCLKKKATNVYHIHYRGYGSIFDNMDTKFQCCDDCDNPEYDVWFNEEPLTDGFNEIYQYENEIYNLIQSLSIEGLELFKNTFDYSAYKMDQQDWIDYELNELPDEKCHEYGFYSSKDIEAYHTKFPTCEYVINVLFNDGSKGSYCPFGAFGDYGQKIDKCGNLCEECTDCKYYKKRETSIKEIDKKDLSDWIHYVIYKLHQKEYEEKFGE